MLQRALRVSSKRYKVSTSLPSESVKVSAWRYDPSLLRLEDSSPTLMLPSEFSMKLPTSRPASVLMQLRVAPLSKSMASFGMPDEVLNMTARCASVNLREILRDTLIGAASLTVSMFVVSEGTGTSG